MYVGLSLLSLVLSVPRTNEQNIKYNPKGRVIICQTKACLAYTQKSLVSVLLTGQRHRDSSVVSEVVGLVTQKFLP